MSNDHGQLKKVRDTEFKVKGYQMVALLEYGNTICRAHWDKDQIIEAFKQRGIDIDIYRPACDHAGGANIYILVNRGHRKYEYVVGGVQGDKI